MKPRVAVDTNVFLSALLFSGELNHLVPAWKGGKFFYLLSKPILQEYLRVLSYPKFSLTDQDIRELIHHELLPFVETVSLTPVPVPRLKDRDDEKFLHAAICGKATHLITGDKELLSLGKIKSCSILPPANFLKTL